MSELFESEAVQILLIGTFAHLLASVANAVVPNEADDAPAWKRMIGKVIRGAALGVGQAVPKPRKR